MRNDGVINIQSGEVDNRGAFIGIVQAPADTRPDTPAPDANCRLGIITVLACESQAMTAELHKLGDCSHEPEPDGYRFHDVTPRGLTGCRIVSAQTTTSGQEAAAATFDVLRERFRPSVTALVGIAGSISRVALIGDVVIGLDVIDYEPRKELPTSTQHRGNQLAAPWPIRRAVNQYFSDHGEPHIATVADPDGVERTFRVVRGLIGSGRAVIADADSPVRRYLLNYNDKVVAVETEAVGLATAFQERVASSPWAVGWLTVRGISDEANVVKSDEHQCQAAWHAALVITWLLPYLAPLRGR